MMANRHRGEVAAKLNGRDWILCLTLGALAELEAAFEADNLSDLIARFSTGRLSARDMLRILCAGLRGGGHVVSEDDVADMRSEGGAAGFASVVAALLTATFGVSEKPESDSPPNP
ncbi:MAG: gene transfer agent family protein [Candidatus Ochrobactrum gambitense]|nr:MAG: gene transfer agent family protein [Candidatus Ochrobactrum gambitense]WEK17023.1 MAG: gene transfer agent family protein [Candidatus Ochrobactrum gambitense]